MDHAALRNTIEKFKPLYWCVADEIGEKGTFHTHIFLYTNSPARFSTIRRRFPGAHIEKCKGTAHENRDYIAKIGRWDDSRKAETSVPGSFEEFGTLPDPAAESASPRMVQLMDDIQQGLTNEEIIRKNPSFGFRLKQLDQMRETLMTDKFKKECRNVTVVYLYGDTGTGKTRSIFQRHSIRDICRITSYGGRNGAYFDAYSGQPVLVLEEFRSQIPIALMLNLLDTYPIMLPARFYDRVACFSTVYITSNISLEEQYLEIQKNEPETWRAFKRRINCVVEFRRNAPPKEVNFCV